MTLATAQPVPAVEGWPARIELGFEARDARTVLVHRRHHGPLRVQRTFHPESDGTCHVYLLHPPGGVVGGDSLAVEVDLATGTRALVTTPAATKFYRSDGRRASQRQRMRIAAGARLEWLPQENIVYEGANVAWTTSVELDPSAELIAWDITCLGRPSIEEGFGRGLLEQRLEIERAGISLLLERSRYEGGHPLLAQPFGLGGKPVVGSLVCVSAELRAEIRDAVRETLEARAPSETSCTLLPHALVCRYLGRSTERARRAFAAAWETLRASCFGTQAVPPRIWAT